MLLRYCRLRILVSRDTGIQPVYTVYTLSKQPGRRTRLDPKANKAINRPVRAYGMGTESTSVFCAFQ